MIQHVSDFMKKLWAVCFLSILSSCKAQEYVDVSLNPMYSDLVDSRIVLQKDTWAIGVTSDKNYQKQIDYVLLVPGVGFDGPEVVFREKVRRGSVIKINKVLSKKGLFKAKSYLSVNFIEKIYSSYEVRVKIRGRFEGENYGLDSQYFLIQDVE